MLEINDITISYGEKVAVSDFSLKLNKGQIVSIVGESGSGKTTVIRSLIGLLPSSAVIKKGQILFEGKSILDTKTKDFSSLRGKEICMIFQDCGSTLNPIKKIGSQFVEYIRVHDKSISKKEAEKMSIDMLRNVMMSNPESIMKKYSFQLSGGMRQRVGIAMAMVFNPKLLLADEPTSALDATIQSQIVRQMIELNRTFKTAIIQVTHNIGVAAYMSDKIIVMKDGKIVEQGDKSQIINHPVSGYTKSLLASIPTINGESYV